jgi:hypothetical protein
MYPFLKKPLKNLGYTFYHLFFARAEEEEEEDFKDRDFHFKSLGGIDWKLHF